MYYQFQDYATMQRIKMHIIQLIINWSKYHSYACHHTNNVRNFRTKRFENIKVTGRYTCWSADRFSTRHRRQQELV